MSYQIEARGLMTATANDQGGSPTTRANYRMAGDEQVSVNINGALGNKGKVNWSLVRVASGTVVASGTGTPDQALTTDITTAFAAAATGDLDFNCTVSGALTSQCIVNLTSHSSAADETRAGNLFVQGHGHCDWKLQINKT